MTTTTAVRIPTPVKTIVDEVQPNSTIEDETPPKSTIEDETNSNKKYENGMLIINKHVGR